MRGKGKLENSIKTTTRITPAYAGKSMTDWLDNVVHRDHPRLCGEKLLIGLT